MCQMPRYRATSSAGGCDPWSKSTSPQRGLHADGYELIAPNAHVRTKQEYLADIESGSFATRSSSPPPRSWCGAEANCPPALQARITVRPGGPPVSMTCWHTDYYERRDGGWRAVWSQATAFSPQALQDQPFRE